MAQHVFTGITPPAFTPSDVGQHYIDTVADTHYLSVGTSSSADWKPVALDINGLPQLDLPDNRTAVDDEVPIYDTSAAVNKKVTLSDFFVQRHSLIDQASSKCEDFIEDNLGGLTATGAGTGNSTQTGTYGMDNIENALGISQTDTGTTATGRRTVGSSTTLTTGMGRLRTGIRFALEQLSDGVNTFTTYLGFINNTGAGAPTAGAYFQYTHGTNSGRWQAVTAEGGGSPVRTAVDTGVTANTLYSIFEVEIASDTSEALFYINGSLVATVSTTLPPQSTTGNDTFGYGWKIEKSVGTTSVAIATDWYYFEFERDSAR